MACATAKNDGSSRYANSIRARSTRLAGSVRERAIAPNSAKSFSPIANSIACRHAVMSSTLSANQSRKPRTHVGKCESSTYDRFHGIDVLVGITLKPWRPGLPVRQLGVVIAIRHLDLRQTLFVEDFVLRDHLVQEEQVGRQRIYLIGAESPLIPERHGAMNEIPHRRRQRRVQWQYALKQGHALPMPDGNILACFRFQRGRQPPYARCAMTADAPLLLKKFCALLGGAAARREFLSRRTDRDIQSADFFCGRSAPHAIRGRGLRERGAPQEQHNRDKPKRAHWSRSRPWR